MKSSVLKAKKNNAFILIEGRTSLNHHEAIKKFEEIINAYGSLEDFSFSADKKLLLFIKIPVKNIESFKKQLITPVKILKKLSIINNRVILNNKASAELPVPIVLTVLFGTKKIKGEE